MLYFSKLNGAPIEGFQGAEARRHRIASDQQQITRWRTARLFSDPEDLDPGAR